MVSAEVNVQLKGESTCLICIQLKERDSNLAIRNFLFDLKLFLMPKVPYPYEVNGKLVPGNGSLIPICSLSNHSLLPSLTVSVFWRFPVRNIFLHFWSWVWFWFRQLCSERKLTVSFNIENLTLFNPSWTKQLMEKNIAYQTFNQQGMNKNFKALR